MGSRNAIFLLLAIVLLLGGLYALLGLGDSGDAKETDSGVPSATLPKGGDVRPPADLLAPDETNAPRAGETARSVVAPIADPDAPAAASREEAPRIRGRIIDKLGVGVPGARVIAAGPGFLPLDVELESGDEERWTTETAADGSFSLTGPSPGSMRLAVRNPGYAPYTRSDVPLPAGEEVELDPIMISLGAILSGRVVDPRGRGVAGAKLKRQANATGGWSFPGMRSTVATTEADGSFRIDQLACGAWSIAVESEEYPDRTFEGLAESPGREYGGLEFQLQAGALITGRAIAVPEEERGALQVRAHRVREDDMFGFGSQDVRLGDVGDDGTFEVRGLRIDADYDLQLRTKSDHSAMRWFGGGGSSRSETVRARAGDQGVELAYRPEAALVFRVLDAKTKAPVTNFRVEAGVDWKRVLTGEDDEPLLVHPDGRVRYGNLRPDEEDDRVDLAVIATGYEEYRRDGIDLQPGEELDLGEIMLTSVPVLRVTVLDDETRAPVAGASVELERQPEPMQSGMRSIRMSVSASGDHGDIEHLGSESRTAKTDENGVALLTSMPGEKCRLRVTADKFAQYELNDLELPEEKDAEQQVRLLAGGQVLVKVVDPDGEPMPGVDVSHRPPSALETGERMFSFGPSSGNVTDTEGEVLFQHLVTGTHAFGLEESGGGFGAVGLNQVIAIQGVATGNDDSGWERIEVVEGETANVTLVAKPRGTLIGRVREAGAPLPGASLRLSPKSEDDDESDMRMIFAGFGGGPNARTDGDGLYEFTNLQAGLYTLTVEHPTRHMSDEFEVRVTEGEKRFDLELTVSIVEGRITDQAGEPLAGLRVSAQRPQQPGGGTMMSRMIMVSASTDGGGDVVYAGGGEPLGDEVVTDEDGRYRLRGVTPDVELQIEASGPDVQTGRSETVQVAPDQVKTGVDFTLKAAGRVRIEALKSDGTPVQFAQVQATYVGADTEESVDPERGFIQNGSTTLRGLRPGLWKVTVTPVGQGQNDGGSKDQEVEVTAMEEAALTFHLD